MASAQPHGAAAHLQLLLTEWREEPQLDDLRSVGFPRRQGILEAIWIENVRRGIVSNLSVHGLRQR